MFVETVREEIKQANAKMRATEISKEAGKRWKALGKAEKQVLTDRADEAKNAYQVAHAAFLANGSYLIYISFTIDSRVIYEQITTDLQMAAVVRKRKVAKRARRLVRAIPKVNLRSIQVIYDRFTALIHRRSKEHEEELCDPHRFTSDLLALHD